MLVTVLTLAVVFLARTAILLLLLWIMIKIQDLDYNFLGLLGSAALASALDMVPHFGHLMAVPLLYLCIAKVTQASLFPDAAFTVMISYALMFGVNLFLFASLMGDLRPSDKNVGIDENATPEMAGEFQPVTGTNKFTHNTATNLTPAGAANLAEGIARQFSIKGLVRNSAKSAVTVQCGAKTYAIFLGEAVTAQTDDGLVSVRFVEAGTNWVILNISGKPVKFPLH